MKQNRGTVEDTCQGVIKMTDHKFKHEKGQEVGNGQWKSGRVTDQKSQMPRTAGTSMLKEELEVCQRVEWKSDYERFTISKNDRVGYDLIACDEWGVKNQTIRDSAFFSYRFRAWVGVSTQ